MTRRSPASGITTVFDSLRAGQRRPARRGHQQPGDPGRRASTKRAGQGPAAGRAPHASALRDLHRRRDRRSRPPSWPSGPVDLMSLMDHTPGQRQFRDVEKFLDLLPRQDGPVRGGAPDARRTPASRSMAALGAKTAAPWSTSRAGTASPWRATTTRRWSTCEESLGRRASRSPSSRPRWRPPRPSHAAGIGVLMGAPNVVRGGSHSGNVAAEELAREACSTSCRRTTCRRACSTPPSTCIAACPASPCRTRSRP